MSDDRRMIYEGQAVSAAIEIKVVGNKFVFNSCHKAYCQEPKNCNIPKSTSGIVKAVEDDKSEFTSGHCRAIWWLFGFKRRSSLRSFICMIKSTRVEISLCPRDQ